MNVTLPIQLGKTYPFHTYRLLLYRFQIVERTFISTFSVEPFPIELGQKSIICYTKTMEKFAD